MNPNDFYQMWPRGDHFPKPVVDTVTIPKETIDSINKQFPTGGQVTPEVAEKINKLFTKDGKAVLVKEAIKFDDGKVDWTLVPFEALEGMVKVLEFGAKKYAAWNWTEGGGFKWTRLVGSCLRHLFAWARGQDNDPESGLSHIYHAQCNLLFLAYYIGNKEKFSKDDRNVR